MPNLSAVDIAELVTEYGFADPVTATAVVIGESGGNPDAENVESDNVDRGLWQISTKWHPEVPDDEAYDVQKSTEHALRISKGGVDFNEWNATRHPRWPNYVDSAEKAVAKYQSDGDDGGDPWWKKIPIFTSIWGDGLDTGDVLSPFDTAKRITADLGEAAGAVVMVGEYVTRVLQVLTSADFWKRAGLAAAGVVLVALGLVAVFGRDALRARTGGIAPAPAVIGDNGDDSDDDE